MSQLTRRQFIGTATGLGLVSPAVEPAAAGLEIHPRSEWATDRPPKGPLAAEEVKFLLVHHSASRTDHEPGETPAILRSFYDFHTSPEKGWYDIAYNFLIDSGGGIWEGRTGSLDGPVAGDATGGNQGFSQLVCLIGDYNESEPTSAALGSLVAVLAWLADRHGIDTTPGSGVTFTSKGSNLWSEGESVTTPTIAGHRVMSRTTCPGSNLDPYVVGELMADVTVARRASATTEQSDSAPVAQESSTIAQTAVTSDPSPSTTSTSSTTIPATPPPTRSPLLLIAAGLASLATLLAAWRARRMRDR
jgi:hypothetical protein